ncbi:MAG: Methyltransferase type 12 [Candidatus Wolfebacteria bacterium GW2011_GWB1_41_12]|uniref:Methyltransferase type 12 n=1 Tax=Candidatus Wolfebacteria bacterium GW2011_GWB1_41_12 TaxID=1619006 RepID=A0A0G0UHW3_9BACT|nr:MAG: Methyltransferase type 12 [Candidatus Wolfebacteria bacterium GW2011_GWB1_41_12]
MTKKFNINCPICNSNKAVRILKENKFNIYKCLSCDLQFVWPQPDKEALKKTYSKKYFHGNILTPKGYEDYHQLNHELIREAKKKIKFIEKYPVGKNLLDIGCGTGIFLEEARRRGYKINGNEISSYTIKALKQKNISCFPGAVEGGILPKKRFDIVTAWDVIEHIPKIKMAFKEIVGSLKESGYLFLTTPDTQSIDSFLMGKSWYNYKKAPEHVLFLNRKSVTELFKASNLKLISVTQWGFYRNLNFLIKRLPLPRSISNPLLSILKLLRLSDLTFFFPFTDFLVVAKKN